MFGGGSLWTFGMIVHVQEMNFHGQLDALYWLLPALLTLLYAHTVRPAPAIKASSPVEPESSDEEEEVAQSEHEKDVWKRVEGVLREYSLSPLVMVAARKWMRQMADPSNETLARLRGWILLRVNGKLRAPPPSPWQSGCPEIIGGLRAQPVWPTDTVEWLRPFEENAAVIREELLALRDR